MLKAYAFRSLLIIATILVIFFLYQSLSTSSSQNAFDETLEPTLELEEALQLKLAGFYDEALQKYRKIAVENPGKAIAAESQQEIADIYRLKSDKVAAISENQDIINKYPGTAYWETAKINIIGLSCSKASFDTWVEQSAGFIQEMGGISIADLLHDNADKFDINNVQPGLRNILGDTYATAAGILDHSERYDDALRIAVFVRENFPKVKCDVSDAIKEIVLDKKNLYDRTNFPDDATPPAIRPIAPREDNTIGDTMPKIEVELSDGDISQYQVDLLSLEFTLDGEDLTDKITARTTINTSGELGPEFEKLRIEYQPATALASGKHTVYVKVSDNGEQAAEKTWSFTVK